MRIKHAYLLFLFFSCFSLQNDSGRPHCALFFDLGGVIVKTDKMKAFWHLGPVPILMSLFRLQPVANIKKNTYAFLNNAFDGPNTKHILDPDGDLLPNIFCDVLAGKYTMTEIHQEASIRLKEQKHSYPQSSLIQRTLDIFFKTETFVQILKVDPAMIQVIQACAFQGHELFIFSNYAVEPFIELCKNCPELAALFDADHIILSGACGCLKPEPEIFDCALERAAKYGLDKEHCYLIDDTSINVLKAGIHGMNGILYTNTKKVIAELQEAMIL